MNPTLPRIQQLSAAVITQIAAGEVIERPASVLKELVENSLDAGSKRIDVEVSQGGTDLIRVVDDGGGILPEDLPLAFASHATSKLTSADDLFRVGTLGFRGEGLASVGGIAQVALQSRPADQPYGAEITCHGGQLSAVRAWNGAPGTRVEVRHLFYNTPVRRKFLRGPGTEMGHISEMFTRLALSPRAPHLTLRHNGKVVHQVPLSADLLDRVALFFGPELGRRLYPVDAQEGPVRLEGYVADPACERGGAQMQYWYVNGRWVRERGLSQALHDAYRGLLMTGRHAVAFLFLELPPDQVDVNVHPTKSEVRFRDGEAVRRLVFMAVQSRLKAEDLTAHLRVRVTPARSEGSSSSSAPLLGFAPPPPPATAPGTGSGSVTAPIAAPTLVLGKGAERRTLAPSPPVPPPDQATEVGTPPDAVKALQLHELYLVVEVPEGMLVIDQHALHERILFEQLQGRLGCGPLETQGLLIPEPVDLPATQTALVLEHQADLAELGLGVEDFGGNTVLLTRYPAVLSRCPPQDILRAVGDYLAARERAPRREEMLNDLLSLMACHSAVRAGDRLTPAEITALVAQRHLAQDAHHCPHGRPTSLLFSHHDLNRQFRRT